MIKIKDILKEIERYAPLPLQESFDNAGVQAGDVNQPASGALLCLDVTEEIVDEAIAKGCQAEGCHGVKEAGYGQTIEDGGGLLN